jgi:hypothetical protein
VKIARALVGLNQRVRNEYYDYVEIRDFDPRVLELPNPLLLLFMQRNPTKASDFIMQMHRDRDAFIEVSNEKLSGNSISPELRRQATSCALATFEESFIKDVSLEDLIHSYVLGFQIGRLDVSRRGERPPVAIGIHREAVEHLGSQASKNDKKTGSASAVMLRRGFFAARAGF